MRLISRCLNKQLANLCQQAIQLEELTQKISQLLPEQLAPHCSVASFNKGCLNLGISDPVWATQLRYLIPELRDKLRKEAKLYQLTSIKITITTPQPLIEEKNTYQKKGLSQHAKETIIRESTFCTYQPLKKALLDLAE